MSRGVKRAPRGRPRGRPKEQTRARILAAAEVEFAAVGYDGARTVAIARRAGLTHAMLHYYFDTKAALYRAVLERVLTDLAAQLWAAVGSTIESGPAIPLRHLLGATHTIFAQNPRFIRVMLWELAAGAPRLDAIAGPFFDGTARVVRLSGKLGLLRPPHDARDVAVTLLASLIFYFTEDPLVLRLFGRDRFGTSDCRRRSEHLAALADALLLPDAVIPRASVVAVERVIKKFGRT